MIALVSRRSADFYLEDVESFALMSDNCLIGRLCQSSKIRQRTQSRSSGAKRCYSTCTLFNRMTCIRIVCSLSGERVKPQNIFALDSTINQPVLCPQGYTNNWSRSRLSAWTECQT